MKLQFVHFPVYYGRIKVKTLLEYEGLHVARRLLALRVAIVHFRLLKRVGTA
jgi:hypothetical protein